MAGRPEELENLIRLGHLAEAIRIEGTIRQFLINAQGMYEDGKRPENSVHGRFTCAYEAVHCLAMAFLRHYHCRPGGEGHRQQALQVFVQQIGLNQAFATISRAHGIRNDKTYHEPAPPVDQTTIDGLLQFIEMALPLMWKLIGLTP